MQAHRHLTMVHKPRRTRHLVTTPNYLYPFKARNHTIYFQDAQARRAMAYVYPYQTTSPFVGDRSPITIIRISSWQKSFLV
jgi:hypothetical protein